MKAMPTTKELLEMLYAEQQEIFHRPKREWVELTDEDIYTEARKHEKFAKDGSEWFDRGSFARAIQQWLKEKNT